jgi:hypothetical protein
MGDKELGAGAAASVKQEIEAVSATTMLESAAALGERERRGLARSRIALVTCTRNEVSS